MRSSSFRVSEGRTLPCAQKLIALQGELVVRLRLPTILDFRISHSLSRFEVLLQARTDEYLSLDGRPHNMAISDSLFVQNRTACSVARALA
jgi:hypothetical protein